MPLDLSRRSLFVGLGASLIAAPAIVRAASLMPVRRSLWPDDWRYAVRIANVECDFSARSPAMDALADIDEITRRVRLAFENPWPIPAGEWKAQWGEHEINAAL